MRQIYLYRDYKISGGCEQMLSVIIPVYNEERTIRTVIKAVERVPIQKEIIIVNDASTDNTKRILEEMSTRHNLKIIHAEGNAGKGAAIKCGLELVTGDLIIIQDGDLENDPQDYLKVIKPLQGGITRVVYGSRFLNGRNNAPPMTYIGNKLLAIFVNLLFGCHITDESTCYKAFDANLLKSFKLECQRFDFCPEVTAKTLRAGHRIVEVPISYFPRTAAEGKKLKYLNDGLKAVWTLIKYRCVPMSRVFKDGKDKRAIG